MATDVEKLVVSLEASITKYEKAMAKAVGEARSTSAKIEKEFSGLDAKISGALTSFAGGAISGVGGAAAAFLSLEGIVQGASAAFEKFGQVADLSGRAALDPEFFQGIAFQASQAGVSIEAMGAALASFAKNSALAAEGHGRMAAQLQVLNPALLESIQLATTQEQRFRLVVDALNGVSNEAERIAIASAAFGDAGAAIASAFEGGTSALDDMLQKARDAGIVVSDELIARADELGDQWERNATVIDTQLKAALVDLGPVIVGLTNLAAGFANAIARGVAGLHAAGQWMEQHNVPQGKAAGATVGGMFGTPTFPEPSSLTPSWMGSPNVSGGIDTGLGSAIQGATPSIEQLNGAADELFQTIGAGAPAIEDLTSDLVGVGAAAGKGGGGKGGGGKGAADGVAELIAELQHEKDALGMSKGDQEVANALRKAGADATAEQKAQIEELVRSIEAEKAALDMQKEAMQEFKSLAGDALKGFISDLREGKSAAEALGNALNNIADKLLNKGIDMLLNAATSPDILKLIGLAEGGIVVHGMQKFASGGVSSRAAIFGEAGPEAAVPLPNGRQIPVDLNMRNAANGPGEMKITVGVAADSMGNILPFVQSVTTRGITAAAPTIIATANKTAPAAIAQHTRDVAGSDYRLR